MSTLYARFAAQAMDTLVAAAFVAAVVVLCVAAYWLVPFQWTPPRVAA
jgi:hypothetical protein